MIIIKHCYICKKIIWDNLLGNNYQEKEIEECGRYYYYYINPKEPEIPELYRYPNVDKNSEEYKKLVSLYKRTGGNDYFFVREADKKHKIFAHKKCIKAKGELVKD